MDDVVNARKLAEHVNARNDCQKEINPLRFVSLAKPATHTHAPTHTERERERGRGRHETSSWKEKHVLIDFFTTTGWS